MNTVVVKASVGKAGIIHTGISTIKEKSHISIQNKALLK